MRIHSVNYTNTPTNFRANTPHTASRTHSPVHEGVNTAGAWFGFGVGLDFVSRKCNFFKSPVKNSFMLNGIIGVAAGVVTGCKALSKRK